eukprot:scaffold937_cov502-Prasinococcus_capsulatus_cf.AAC.4
MWPRVCIPFGFRARARSPWPALKAEGPFVARGRPQLETRDGVSFSGELVTSHVSLYSSSSFRMALRILATLGVPRPVAASHPSVAL